MNNKSTIVALALLVLLASCACLGAFASWTLNSATSRAEALATEATTATSDAHAVSVCVGLINAGSCTARWQTFPDWYELPASKVLACRIIGNAIPPRLAEIVYRQLLEQISS